MARVFDYIIDAVRRPREQLSRGQQFVRYSRDLGIHCYHQLQRHRAEGMAAELTYRTIFSLVPVVVLGLVMFRVFGGLDEVQAKVENQLYSFFGVPDIPDAYLSSPSLTPGEGDPSDFVPQESDSAAGASDKSTSPGTTGEGRGATAQAGGSTLSDSGAASENAGLPAGASQGTESEIANRSGADDGERPVGDAERAARANIRKTLRSVTAKVSSIDFASIGVFGLLLFIYAAVALADSTEHLFNRIYEAPTQRPLHIRVAIHWSIITLGSGLLAMSLYMSGQVIDWFGAMGAGSNIRWMLSHFVAISASWVLLFLLYALMPNTHVSVKAAAVGAMVAALLWEFAKFGFQIYVTKAVPYSAIYGSIGLIPLFLFWMYVTWLIVLFGLILTYTLQTLRGSRVVRDDRYENTAISGDPDWMLPIMSEVARAFSGGGTIDNQELADRLGLSSRVSMEMVSKLVEAHMLLRVSVGAGEEDALTLAKPAEKIMVTDILAIAHASHPTSSHDAWRALSELKEAEREAVAGVTLAELAVERKGPRSDPVANDDKALGEGSVEDSGTP